jgi:ribosomal protein L11 methyltransferase
MSLHQWQTLCTAEQVEWLSDALTAMDALSVSVEDADALTEREVGLFGEPGMPPPAAGWSHSKVSALFSSAEDASHACSVIMAQPSEPPIWSGPVAAVVEQDWVRLTQSQFDPIAITDHFWIVPSWHEVPEQAHYAMRLDPGLAFGTGTHPTTRMCLQWLAGPQFAALLSDAGPQPGVLDYGCGSGVLAIAAGLIARGPRNATDATGRDLRIDAVDIDPAAVEATNSNADLNGVTLNAGISSPAGDKYQVVLANILAQPLKILAPLLCAHLADGAHLVLAGILSRQVEELKTAYAPHVALQVLNECDGWVLMGATYNRREPNLSA